MNRYVMTSAHWEGHISFEYNELGMLVSFSVAESGMSSQQHEAFLKMLPRTSNDLERIRQSYSHLTVNCLVRQVGFDEFWNRYDEKDRSSKKKAARIWERMHPIDRAKAFDHINKYFASIPPGVAKKYAETYLNAELWNN